MPMSLKNWQKYGRRWWMWRMKVRHHRIIAEMGFVLPSGKIATAVIQEYTLPDGKILFEQYVFWVVGTTVDVVMVGMREVDAYRYA